MHNAKNNSQKYSRRGKKSKRAKVQQIHAALKGKSVTTLNANQKEELLLLLCLALDLADKNGVIK